jgi:UDP-N-acetylmuramoyl-tripeptide--D-alanyl-D-alanine ligase
MRELGAHADAACRALGAAAAAADLDVLILLGAQADLVRASAVDAGMDPRRVIVVADHDEAASRVRAVVREGDVVLLKGSRGAALERVLQRLEQEA